jgi:hypothetical protein
VSIKRKPTVDDLYDAKHYGKPSVSDNAPESSSLTPDERTYIEAGLSALALLRKTFESWVTVGRAIQTLREKADRMGTRKAFARLLEQQGFGEFNKDRATCTRLLRVIENLGEVSAWHAGLEPKQQKAWAHPSTVFLHCPAFKKPKAQGTKPRTAKPDLDALMAEHEELKAAYNKLRDERIPAGNAKAAKFAHRGAHDLNNFLGDDLSAEVSTKIERARNQLITLAVYLETGSWDP